MHLTEIGIKPEPFVGLNSSYYDVVPKSVAPLATGNLLDISYQANPRLTSNTLGSSPAQLSEIIRIVSIKPKDTALDIISLR